MTRCGSTSYSTLIARFASSAVGSSTAATATIEAPAQKISVPTSETMCTALTPGICSAALMSMLFILACACGERSILPKSIPGRLMSNEYFARPETFCGPSILEMRFPMRVRLSASGHLYSAIALTSFLPFLRRLRDSRSNAHVRAAPAGIASESLLNLFGCRVGVLVEERLAGNYETWSTEAALLSIIIDERLLNRMQSIALH